MSFRLAQQGEALIDSPSNVVDVGTLAQVMVLSLTLPGAGIATELNKRSIISIVVLRDSSGWAREYHRQRITFSPIIHFIQKPGFRCTTHQDRTTSNSERGTYGVGELLKTSATSLGGK